PGQATGRGFQSVEVTARTVRAPNPNGFLESQSKGFPGVWLFSKSQGQGDSIPKPGVATNALRQETDQQTLPPTATRLRHLRWCRTQRVGMGCSRLWCFFESRLRARLAGSKAPRRRGALQDASRVHRQWGQVRTFDNLNPGGF